MRHSTTLWAAVGVLSLVAAEPELAAIPFDSVPQLDENGFDKRQCCCQQTTTVTETDCGYVPIPEPVTEYVTVYVDQPTTIYTTVEETVTDYETQVDTVIRTTSYPVTVDVPINCVPAGEGGDYPGYPTDAVPEECSTVTTTEWRTTTVLDFVTSYRPTTVPTTVEVEVPVPTTVRNTVTDYNTVTDEATITNEVTDRITTTLPGETVTRTITSTLADDTITVTEDGETVTSTLPGSTVVVTTTEVLPGETVIVTPIFDVTLCPRPTGDGTPIDYSSDETWGCKPGYVCNPPKPDGCNFFPELPTEDFRCQPQDCMVAPPYINTTWEEGESSYYPPSYGYFNLNPEAFGLSYGIFEFEVYVEKDKHTTRTITTGDWESQATLTAWPKTTSTTSKDTYDPYAQHHRRSTHWLNRRDIIPNVCYDTCNGAALIIQSLGKVPENCMPDSTFQNAYNRCADCIEVNGNSTKETIRDYIEPEFAQFFRFCEEQESTPTSTPDPDGPESQVTSAEETTETQESAVSPTFEPITTTTEEGDEEEEPTTTAEDIATTTASEEEEEESPATTEPAETEPAETEAEDEDEPTTSAGESSEETPEPSATTTEDAGGEEESSTIYTAVTITEEDGDVVVTSSAIAVVPVPDDDETVTTPGPSPSSLPEEGEGDENEDEGGEEGSEEGGEEGSEDGGEDESPEVVPPTGDESTPGATPTEPDTVPTAAASALSGSGSTIFITLASMFAVFFA